LSLTVQQPTIVQEQVVSSKPAENVVCRICEKIIPGDSFQTHSERCVQIQNLDLQCSEINAKLLVELAGVEKELQVDINDRRATRRMTYIPGFSDAELIEEYVSKAFNMLNEKQFREYRQLLRDFNDPGKKLKIEQVVDRVKVMFADDDKFLLLKGFIGFLPPNVQISHCTDIMQRIWKREDAELKSRQEIWAKMQVSVQGYVSPQVMMIPVVLMADPCVRVRACVVVGN
jgi:hypothetical protein